MDSLIYKLKNNDEIFEERREFFKNFRLRRDKKKSSFMQGDALNLKDIYTNFDLIFCSNLIDRLYYPLKF